MTKIDPDPQPKNSKDSSTNSGRSSNTANDIQNKLQAHAKPIIAFITAMTPHVINFCQKAAVLYKSLPEDQLQLLIGFMICFFGGVYPALFAAIEAAKHGGLNNVKLALKDLAEEAMVIVEASKKDDTVDQDKDGKPDVNQLDAKALMVRKANLVVTKMNPQKVCMYECRNICMCHVVVVVVVMMEFVKSLPITHFILSNCAALSGQHCLGIHLQSMVGSCGCFGHQICKNGGVCRIDS